MNNLLEAQNVEREYIIGDERLRVLKGISLGLEEGEILSIVGPSGSGKSTLLHIMGFLDRPSRGEVTFRGQSLSRLGPLRQAATRNKHFGFIFQLHHLLPELTAIENVLLPLMILHGTIGWMIRSAFLRRRALDLLDRLGLGARTRHHPNELSGGERQRVAIARALVTRPSIVFCDEPTGSLDVQTSREVQRILVDLNRETRTTFVIVTHDPDVAKLGRRQIQMIDGRIEPVPKSADPSSVFDGG
jgi:lipoprotein-releasing system ATP-binding protein